MQADLLQGFYLGDLLVEPLKGRVSSRAASSHLPPKAAEVLLCLARRAGDVVERQALIDDVWGPGQGSPEALNHAVGELRHALGDHPAEPSFVQTLPRRGYRLIVTPVPVPAGTDGTLPEPADFSRQLPLFEALRRRGVLETAVAYLVTGWLLIQVADVVFGQLLLPRWAGTFVTVLVIAGFPIAVLLSWFLELREGRAVLDTRSDANTPKRRFSRTYLSIVSAMFVASIGVFAYDRLIGLPLEVEGGPAVTVAEEPDVRDNSIAVLPFFNIDGSDTSQIFAHGLAEDVINRLASVPGLAVASRGDSWTLAPNSPSADVRRRLRVAYYLEGSVRITSGLLRVVVQLIDSRDGFHIISRDFETEIEDFHQVQQEITNLTVANLRVALPPDTQPVLDAAFDETEVDAYVLYQRGREIYQAVRSVQSIDEAIHYYREALEVDSEYAAAYAGICDALVNRYELGADVEDIRSAETACARALDRNSRLYMVYAALGTLYRRTGRDDEAVRAYLTALEINPQEVSAMIGLSSIYRQRRHLEEAENLLLGAVETQPGNWRTLDSLGSFYFRLGRYTDAADAYSQVVALEPENGQVLGNLGSARMMAGDFDGARLALEKALKLLPDGRYTSNLGIINYYLGRFDESVELHRRAVEQAPNTTLLWINLGDALFFSGRGEDAREAFQKAADLAEQQLLVDAVDWEQLTMLAWARQMLGETAEVPDLVDRMLLAGPNDPYSYYYKALIEVRRGEVDRAMETLDRAVALGYPPVMLEAEPYLEPLKSNRRFQTLVAGND